MKTTRTAADFETFSNKMSVKNLIVGTSTDRGSMFNSDGTFTFMMAKADEQGNFVSDIIEKATKGQIISEKQAWCVAFFAQKIGLVN